MLTLPDASSLNNESDVEQKVVFPILTTPEPHGLGYNVAELPTKVNIRSLMIDKGQTVKKLYFPDYLVVLGGLPHAVIEAKGPNVPLDEAFREARLYANELNAVLPTDINPVTVAVAINAEEMWVGPVDQAEPAIKASLSEITVYSEKFAAILKMVGRTSIARLNNELLSRLRPSAMRKPRRLLGGGAVQNEEVGYNSFGAAIHSEFSHIFNPSTYEERVYIARNAYVPSRRRERYVDPIDRVIRASRPASEIHATEFDDTSRPNELIGKLATAKDLENKVLLIVGSVGSGKTTFIDHLREVSLPSDLKDSTLWIRLNMNVAPANKEEIFNWIRGQLISECRAAYKELDFDSLETIEKVYAVEVNRFKKGVGKLYEGSPLYNQKLGEMLEAQQSNLQETARAYTRFCGTERGKLVITVLDNCDKRTRDVQLLMFEVAQWMQKEFRTLVMLPLRDETFDNYRNTPPLDTAQKDFVFRIEPPMFHQVLTTRVQLALDKLAKGNKPLDYELPNGMRVQYGTSDLSYYLTSILSSIFEHDRYVRRMLVGLTGRNIRKALEIFVEFCTSGHIREDEIFKIRQKKGDHSLPLDIVSRVLLRMNRRHYDSENSYLKNLLAANQQDTRPFYFTRVAILRWLQKHFSESGPAHQIGYFPVRQVKETLAPLGIGTDAITREIEYLVGALCITTEDFSTTTVNDEMLIRLAPAGFVHLEMLQNTSYLAAIAEDTYFDTDEQARRIAGRINNIELQYSDTSTLLNAQEVLNYFERLRTHYSQLPDAYLKDSHFFELTDLSAARAAVDVRERGLVPAPWISAKEKYTVGSDHECIVTNVKDYGVFVELEPGVWGLIHHDSYPRGSNKKYLLQLNDKILAKVTKIDTLSRRIALTYIDHLAEEPNA